MNDVALPALRGGGDSRPLCIDLFCGRGGWARGFLDVGYRVVGFDIEDMSKWYPGEFVRADVSKLDGPAFRGARVITASPPCQAFTQYNRFTRDPERGMVLVREAVRIIKEAEPDYWVLENVRLSLKYISALIGPDRLRAGPYYFWGTFPPFLRETSSRPYKGLPSPPKTIVMKRGPDAGKPKVTTRWKWKGAGEAARIPLSISRPMAEACLPEV